MPDTPKSDDRLFTIGWVHLYEQDTDRGEVYAPEDGAIPLSRRPRERLRLRPDGSATMFVGGPDDRSIGHAARWTETGGDILIRPDSGEPPRRIVERSPTRLLLSR